MDKLMLGGSKNNISPAIGVPLAGFMHRTDANLGTIRKLYCRVWAIQHVAAEQTQTQSQTQSQSQSQSRTSLLIQADLIWWGNELVSLLKEKIERQYSIPADQVMFHASHTHSGPQTSKELKPELGMVDDDYLALLESQVLDGIAEALMSLEEVTVEKGTGRCPSLGIHRRRLMDGQIIMAPHPDGPVDDELTVIKFTTLTGKVKAVWFHFTCHPTVTDMPNANSEYCGAAMELVDAQFGDGVSCFLQGCCGDIRPALLKDGEFYRGDDDDVQSFGQALFEQVMHILDRPMTPCPPLNEAGKSVSQRLNFLHDESDYRMLHVQLLPIARGCALLGINGEAVVEYGIFSKKISDSSVLPLGYSNGIIGYLPTEQQIVEGGYESVESAPYFLLPGPYHLDIENKLKNIILHIVRKDEIAWKD